MAITGYVKKDDTNIVNGFLNSSDPYFVLSSLSLLLKRMCVDFIEDCTHDSEVLGLFPLA